MSQLGSSMTVSIGSDDVEGRMYAEWGGICVRWGGYCGWGRQQRGHQFRSEFVSCVMWLYSQPTRHIRWCTNCTAIAVPLKIVYNGSIVCIQWPKIFFCLTSTNYCVEEYIFEFQVFTGIDKVVFRVLSDPSTAITRHACLAAPWRAWCSRFPYWFFKQKSWPKSIPKICPHNRHCRNSTILFGILMDVTRPSLLPQCFLFLYYSFQANREEWEVTKVTFGQSFTFHLKP